MQQSLGSDIVEAMSFSTIGEQIGQCLVIRASVGRVLNPEPAAITGHREIDDHSISYFKWYGIDWNIWIANTICSSIDHL